MQQEPLIEINLREILRQRLGEKRMRFVPSFLVRQLENFIRQDRLNELLHIAYPLTGFEFCEKVLGEMNISYEIEHADRLPKPGPESRVVFVSNHPLGGLDGMVLAAWLCRALETPDVKFIVNDLLSAVRPMSNLFVPVNKHGKQSREAVERIEQVFESNDPVVMFPAGLVSRVSPDGTVRDLQWQKMFVNRAISSKRDVIPLHFIGNNSSFFYNFAKMRKRLGIAFNLEMLRLPAEFVGSENSCFKIVVGDRIPWQELTGGSQALRQAEELRRIVYRL